MFLYNNQKDFVNAIGGRVLTAYVPYGNKLNYTQYVSSIEQWKGLVDFTNKDIRIMYLEYMTMGVRNDGILVEFESRGVEAISLDSEMLNIPEATEALLPRNLFDYLFNVYFPMVEMNPLRLEYLYYKHVTQFFGDDNNVNNMMQYINNLNSFNINYEEALVDVRSQFGLQNINLDNKTSAESFRLTLAADYLVRKYNVSGLLANNMVSLACGDYRAQRIGSFRVPRYGFFNGECVVVNTTPTMGYIDYLNKYKKANLGNNADVTIGGGLSRLA